MLDGMMNQALKIVSNILLFVTSFFVISHLLLDSVISMNYWSISLNLSLFLVMLFLAKYINDLFFLGILKFRKIPVSFYYLFPYFRFEKYSKNFIDPMFLTRSYKYFKIKLNYSNVSYIKKFHLIYLQVILIITVLLIYLFGWQFYLYLPIFILYFGSNIKHPSNDEIQFIHICESHDSKYEKRDDKLISNLQFHTLALMYMENKKVNTEGDRLTFYNRIYSMRDLEFIRYWSAPDKIIKQSSRTYLVYIVGDYEFEKIIKEGIVPLHLKYYKFLTENYYNNAMNMVKKLKNDRI